MNSKFSEKIFKGRREKDDIGPSDKLVQTSDDDNEGETLRDRELRIRRSELFLSSVRYYFLNVSKTCDFGKPPIDPDFNDLLRFSASPAIVILDVIAVSFADDSRNLFMVPRLKLLLEDKNCAIKKCQLVEGFMSFLLQLLSHKIVSIDPRNFKILSNYPWKDRIDNLEKDLRFLHTILGDISLVLCDEDEHEQVRDLLEEFEAVANEAGSLLHSLVFSIHREFKKIVMDFAFPLNRFDLMKPNILRFLNFLSSYSRSAHTIPRTSVVDSLLIIDSLIYDLEDLMKQEDNRVADVNCQISILHRWLISLQSSFKDTGLAQPSEIGELKQPLMRIGDVARQAEYLIISFLVGDAPLWYVINRLTGINDNIELVFTDMLEIIKKYKIGGLKVAKCSSAQLPLQDKRNLEIENVTVGVEDKAIHVLDQLLGGAERLQVISIFGMPGLGKTTLAKKLFNHPSVKERFDKLSWCVVSQTYERRSVLTDILTQLTTEFSRDMISEMDEGLLVVKIHQALMGRRYLIVMDDIWDSKVWDELRGCFPDDGKYSRILFTTRNKDVAPPNSGINYALPPLSNDECWELLGKKVFGSKSCPLELRGIGQRIAANCAGLPLAVVVIAGVLSTMDEKESTWKRVERNLTQYFFDNGDDTVMQILELSYKHLPEYLKPCFLFFGAFSEDSEISAGNLTRLWIAEGFVHKEVGKSAENVAEEYLMELIDKSLVTVTKRRSDGGVKTCVIHDLLRDMCLKRSKEENFLKFLEDNIYSIYETGHRLLALRTYASRTFCQHARSLHASCSGALYVREMRLLRVLHCNSWTTHLIGIEYLIYLKYLVIGDVPASVGSLVNLEYIHVKKRGVVCLPPEIVKMKKLRYIKVKSEARYDRDCNCSETNNLEFLLGLSIWDAKDEEILRCSPHLRKLALQANRRVDISFLSHLESLKIEAEGPVMERTRLPLNIRKLTLSRSRLSAEKISIIGRLENLEVLKLSHTFFEHKRWDTRDGEFQGLTFLKLDAADLVEWNVDSGQHFPKLQRLILRSCRNLTEIPYEIGEIATLQLIEVDGRCSKLLAESAKEIQHEQLDLGNEDLRVSIRSYLF